MKTVQRLTAPVKSNYLKIFIKMPFSSHRQTLGTCTFMIRTHGIYKKNVVVIVQNILPENNVHNNRCEKTI